LLLNLAFAYAVIPLLACALLPVLLMQLMHTA
jgi:hypothetical protein